jgi:hypothetical protein
MAIERDVLDQLLAAVILKEVFFDGNIEADPGGSA